MTENAQGDGQSIRRQGTFRGWTEQEVRQYRDLKGRLFGHLDTIQVNAHGIQTCLTKIKGEVAANKSAAWQDRCYLLCQNLNEIHNKLDQIHREIFNSPDGRGQLLYQKHGDEVARVEEHFDWILRLWNRHSPCTMRIPMSEEFPCGKDKKAADAQKDQHIKEDPIAGKPTPDVEKKGTDAPGTPETGTPEPCGEWKTGLEGRIDEMDRALDAIIREINLITMPPEVNEQLGQMFVGDPLNFMDAFGKDFDGDKEESTWLLTYFKGRPHMIDGLVDVDKGVIYKIDVRAWRRWASLLGLAAMALFGIAGIPVILLNLLKMQTFATSITIPPTNLTWTNGTSTVSQVVDLSALQSIPRDLYWPFMVCALALLIGSLVHVLVMALKENQGREQKEKKGMAIEGWFYWIHVNEKSLALSVIFLWIGFVGIVVLLGSTDLATAFFVGYSIDSFVDLILTRVASVADVRFTEITGKVSGTPAS